MNGLAIMSEAVDKYFSEQASEYQAKSMRWPWSWLRAREANAIWSLLGDVRGRDVLELGVGAGFYTRALIERGSRRVWAVDISQAMLDTLPAGPLVPVLGAGDIVCLNRRFSALISAGMLEFTDDPVSVLV